MLTAIDVANFFISISNPHEDGISNMKVNKLVYLAQGWSMAKLGRELFPEKIQAWQHGPVIPEVYYAFKPCGSNPIQEICGEYSEDKFSLEEIDLLTDIALTYGKYTAAYLRNLTHSHKTWLNHYHENERNLIPNEEIKEFFKTLKPIGINMDNGDTIGYIDDAGYTVLPKEWNDEP